MCLALCLGVVCFALAGNAWAVGTTRLATGTTVPSTYAAESTISAATTGAPLFQQLGNTYVLVNGLGYNSDMYRDMSVARTTAQNFFVVITLQNGAVFQGPGTAATGCPAGVTCRLPANGDIPPISLSGGLNGAATFSIVNGGTTGSNYVTFLSNITTTFSQLPTVQILAGTNNWTIRDYTNRLAAGPIQAMVQTFDAATGDPLDDGGSDSIDIARTANALQITNTLAATTAVIDVATLRQRFVATAPDTINMDNGATVGVGYVTVPSAPLSYKGIAFALTATDTVRLTFTGTDLSGIVTNIVPFPGTSTTPGITWAGVIAGYTAGNTRTLNVAGNNAAIGGGAQAFVFTVDNTTALATRTISVKIDAVLAANQSTQAGGTKAVLGTSNVTTWTLNGTVLLANWLNGNTNAYNSRIYIYNPSTIAADVSVRVLKMPAVGGTVTSAEITTPGAPLSLGTLAAGSGVSIKLKEDILNYLVAALPGGALPYLENGGNLMVEITVRASGVRGTCQVFNIAGTLGFGQTDLMVIQ